MFRGYDERESPAVLLVESLMHEGCSVCAYDPAAADRAREVLHGSIEFATNAYDAATDADALLILTEWEEFGSLDLSLLSRRLRYPIVIDGRNLYNSEEMAAHGFSYYSVGRLPVLADGLASAVRGADDIQKNA